MSLQEPSTPGSPTPASATSGSATSGSTIRSVGGAVVLLIVLAPPGGYAFHEHSVARHLAAQNNDVTATQDATRGPSDALTTKLNPLNPAQPATPAAHT